MIDGKGLDETIAYLYARLRLPSQDVPSTVVWIGPESSRKSTVDELLQRMNEFEARYGDA